MAADERFLGSCGGCPRREVPVVPRMDCCLERPSIRDGTPQSMERACICYWMRTFKVAFPLRTSVQQLCERLCARTRRPWVLACNYCLASEYLATLKFDGKMRHWMGGDLWGRDLTSRLRSFRGRKHPGSGVSRLLPALDGYMLKELRDTQRRCRELPRIKRSPYAARHVYRALSAKDSGNWKEVVAHCRSALAMLKPGDPYRGTARCLLRMARGKDSTRPV
jgi:hypothetical protein